MESLVVEQVESFVPPQKERRAKFQEQALERVGEMRINNLGSLMIIDAYYSSTEVYVRFPQGNIVRCSWQQFLLGSVKNPYDKSVYGVGYLGEGNYKVKDENGLTDQYKSWLSMLSRCYSVKFQEKHKSYIGCTVDERWHNFQVFAEWYDENHYTIEGHRMDLDKDILVKGNKVYSPETCVFAPHLINKLFLKRSNDRGSLPIGVKKTTWGKKFEAQARKNDGSRGYIGIFNTPEEAFEAYKEHKEQIIRDIAQDYKDMIPSSLYNAMLTYEVEITD
jgi:hypothetical protein